MNPLKTLNMTAMLAALSTCVLSLHAQDSGTEPAGNGAEIWRDPSQPIEARVRDLMGRMTVDEKVSQLSCNCPAIPRLGIKTYSHRNECLHGVMSRTSVTCFPEPIGMSATFDTALIHQEADVISTEARAIHNDYIQKHDGNSWQQTGLTFYSPNINIVRDPRWGRGQETYGEDPFLTGRMGVAFIEGLQGDDPRYIKVMACAKHYAVHSGPESQRHTMNMEPSQRDLYETYLPAFEAAVREAHVGSVMGAYSSLYGIPDCASPFLLKDVLRKSWGFDGFVVSDGGAIWDIWAQHKYVPSAEQAAIVAVKGGCDVASGNTNPDRETLERAKDWTSDAKGWLRGGDAFAPLTQAVADGLISQTDIDRAVSDELTARFRVGIFDPQAMVPYSKITMADNDTAANHEIAEKVAEESIVLLKNDNLLPLNRAQIKRIAVIGPNAASGRVLIGNYQGKTSSMVTILNGIKAIAGPGIEVVYDRGCPLALGKNHDNLPTTQAVDKTMADAKSADVVIFVGGIDSTLEGEEMNERRNLFEGFDRGDRTVIELPSPQSDLIKSLYATGKPVIFVNCSGSAIAMPWEAKHLPAIVQAWYPGQEGGTAVAKLLFGDVNPAGRLPITFYNSTADLPSFDNYSMANRTYRYFSGKPLFAFGYGLSYTKFDYGHLDAKTDGDKVHVNFKLKNTGKRDGDEVVQVYFKHEHSAVPQPQLALCGFARVHLASGQSQMVSLDIPVQRLRYWSESEKQYVVEPGKYDMLVGAASDDIRLHSTIKIK
jgi:beta-glucosidase